MRYVLLFYWRAKSQSQHKYQHQKSIIVHQVTKVISKDLMRLEMTK
jgi:hypothetical protein